MTDKRIVLSTAGSDEEARKIATHLVKKRLAACVNIFPQVISIYRWQGKVEEAAEWLLVIKTTEAAFDRVRSAIGKLHSYEVPECISLEIENGSDAYLQWIADNADGKTIEPGERKERPRRV
jgi:periplasmic divalent cation tolerance protein